jgi:hypothetical protein
VFKILNKFISFTEDKVMLILKSFVQKKKCQVNVLLQDLHQTDSQSWIMYCGTRMQSRQEDYFAFDTIKEGNIGSIPYELVKENNTGTWLFKCPSMYIMYIQKTRLEEFNVMYSHLPVVFHVYETPKFFVAICVTHTAKDMEWSTLPTRLPTAYTYLALSKAIGCFLVLNQDLPSKFHRDINFFRYHSCVGDTTVTNARQELVNVIRVFQSLTNIYKHLPVHALSL